MVYYLTDRTDRAYQEYGDWAAGVLKYSYDASRSGTKMQTVPLRPTWFWPQGMRTDLNVVQLRGVVAANGEVVALEPSPLSSLQVFMIGLGIGWVAKEFLGK